MPKITLLGHSAVLLEGKKTKCIIDPFITGNPDITYDLKPSDIKVDYVIVTHGHGDHLGDAIDITKNNDATLIAPYELAVFCQNKGVKKLNPMHIGGSKRFGDDLWVKLTIAHHGSAFVDDNGNITYTGNPCGVVVELDGKKIYHSGDTGLFMDMQLIGELGLDVAMLPIGDNFTMGPQDAAKAVEFLKPKTVIPMHYSAWDIIKQDPNEFVKLVGDKAEVKILKPGESTEI